MGFFESLIRWRYRITNGYRRRRFDFFWDSLGRDAGKQWWLDLGGGPGSYLLTQLETLEQAAPRVLLLDMGENELRDARARFPHVSCVRADGEKLPFCSNAFDLVFCNSVIEHVAHPQLLAAEIDRTGRLFFVQTPNEQFPFESHSHVPLPFFRRMPRAIQSAMCRLAGASWEYLMSVRYLSEADLRAFFPGARILRERALGMTKSFYVLSGETNALSEDA
ncbi:MAG: class I SAM-dependent methyltransferase [Anaerolineae bacterium]|nr:class I SAM-dependent methyltransferase [Anaerolineae bacterium]